MEDIGHLFPSDDPALQGASSIDLLRQAWERIRARGWTLVNVDAIVIMQAPRIAPHRDAMREALAAALGAERGPGHGAGFDHRPSRLHRARRGSRLPGRGAASERRMTPAVVSFDLDETLWAFMPMMDGALGGMIAALELRRPELAGRITVDDLHEHRRLVGEERDGTYRELRLESFRRVLERDGVDDPDLPGWMVEVWMAERTTAVRLHDDVEPELDGLAADGHVLGAITNGNFPFAQLDVAGRFAFIVHAEELGEMKPAAAPFQPRGRALRRRPGTVGARGRRARHRRRRRPGLRHEGGVDQPRRDPAARGLRPGRRAARPSPACAA